MPHQHLKKLKKSTNKTINDPFTARYPRMDIHGETTTTCIALIDSFINDNIKLKEKNIAIIHGKGTGALRKALHSHLKGLKKVQKYYINGLNDGETIIELNL
jgi:DNA mismatch repair protein MutS2